VESRTCYYCNRLKKVGRYFQYDKDKPYVILEDLKTQEPLLIYKEHVECIRGKARTAALEAYKEVCSKLYGDRYAIHIHDDREHFHIRIHVLGKNEEKKPPIEMVGSVLI